MRTKKRTQIEMRNRLAGDLRQAEERATAKAHEQIDWPEWVKTEELFEVCIRRAPEDDYYMIGVTRKGTGHEELRKRPAATAYAEAVRLANRSQLGLFDMRRGR